MDDNGSAHSSLFGDLSTEEVTSKIILTAIVVLFMAVLFVLILHLYAKLYWWRIDQLQQQQQQQQQEQEQENQSSIAPPVITRRQRRRFIFVPGQDASTNTGLTPFELSSLPIVFFRQDSCKDGLECAICLSELVKGDKSRLLPKCSHSFHVECIDMWFQSHSTCPICRNTVLGLEQASSKRAEQVPDNADLGNTNINNHDASLSHVSGSVSNSSPEFPTNVLVWGRQDQVSTGNTNVGSQEDGVGNAASQSQEAVVLDINDSISRSQNVSSSSSSSAMRFIVEEEEPKSPMTTRLRSLRRFLSRDKRVACSISSTSTSSSSSAAASVDP
uniref:RING-type E3 ubiquitin transferase n=1 Tax=Noccaea caerulescens TaxID=107243 RepID=A0A1J3DVZ3_NOCCA